MLTVLVIAGVAVRDDLAVRRVARDARRAVEAGRFSEAIDPLRRWQKARPGAAEAHFLEARVALELNRSDEVLGPLERARELGYPRRQIDRLWGVILARSGRTAEAEPLLREAWEARSGPDRQVAESLARVYLVSLRFGDAAELLGHWAREAPDDPKPFLWWTEIDTRTKADRTVIIGHFREALRRDPGLDKARLGLAKQLLAAGHNPEAAAEFSAYKARNPQDPEGFVGAGLNAQALGDEPAAVRDFERAHSLDPNHTLVLKELARIVAHGGRFEDAVRLLDRAIAVDPFDPELRYPKAVLLSRTGKIAEAEAEFASTARLRKEHLRMAEIQSRLLNNPQDVALRSEAALWMIGHGREEEGLQLAKMVLNDQPGHPETCRALAEYYRKKNEPGLASYYRVHSASPAPVSKDR